MPVNEELLHYELYWKYKVKSINGIRISNNGKYVVLSSSDGYLLLLDDSGNVLWKNQLHDSSNSISISTNETYIATGSNSGILYLFAFDGEKVWQKQMASINAVCLSHNSVIVGTENSTIFNIDLNGNEVWKKKIKGFFEGGIFQNGVSDNFVVGSWNLVYCFSTDGEILWKYKTEKRIMSIDTTNNLIAICTRGGLEVINGAGELLFKSGRDCKKVCIGKYDFLYLLNNSTINVLDSNSQFVCDLNLNNEIVEIDISIDNGIIAAHSKNDLYVYSNALKPKIRILTDSLIVGESKPIEFEIENVCNKKINCNIELRLNLNEINDTLNVELDPLEKRSSSFMITPVKPGDDCIILEVIDKKLKVQKDVFVDFEQVQVDVKLVPKHEFNVVDDEITLLIKMENKSRILLKNISVEEDETLILKELLPKSKYTFEFKIHLDEGRHNVLRNVTCQDDFGNDYRFLCENEIKVENAPYVCSFSNTAGIINGKESEIILDFQNKSKETIDLKIDLKSEYIDFILIDSILSINPLASNSIKLKVIPHNSGVVPVNLSVEEGDRKKTISLELTISQRPPLLEISTSLCGNEYFINELIVQKIFVKNVGEKPAFNVKINKLDTTIPSIKPGDLVTRELKHKYEEVAHETLPFISVKYQDSERISYEAESYDILEFDIKETEINILTNEISLEENKSKRCNIVLENISDRTLENLDFEIVTDNPTITVVAVDKTHIESIQPKSKASLTFAFVSEKYGTETLRFVTRYEDKEIGSFCTLKTETRSPELDLVIDHSKLFAGKHSILFVEVQNVGVTVARNVVLKLNMAGETLDDPVSDYNKDSQLIEVEPGGKIPLRFGITPKNSGDLKLDIMISFESVLGNPIENTRTAFITIEKENDYNETNNQSVINYFGEVVGGNKTVTTDSVVQDSNLGVSTGVDKASVGASLPTHVMEEPETLKVYRNLCVQAYDDKFIADDEKDILENIAKLHNISLEDKNAIEMEIFGDKLNKDDYFRKYREAFYKALTNDGVISTNEENMLNSLRENYNLSTDEQKRIEKEVREELKL